MDPRLVERRRQVLETGARRGMRKALWIMLGISVAAGAVWLAQSPFMSVAEIIIVGNDHGAGERALESAGVSIGTPLILVRTSEIEEAVLADPWIAEVTVDRVFPDQLEIEVLDRKGAAWIWASGEFALVDPAGHVLETRPLPETGEPVIRIPAEVGGPGSVISNEMVLGALEFIVSLPQDRQRLELNLGSEGELWAVLPDHSVRLGRPTEMAEKAAALVAVLSDNPPDGAQINVIAPTRPAIVVPGNLGVQEEG